MATKSLSRKIQSGGVTIARRNSANFIFKKAMNVHATMKQSKSTVDDVQQIWVGDHCNYEWYDGVTVLNVIFCVRRPHPVTVYNGMISCETHPNQNTVQPSLTFHYRLRCGKTQETRIDFLNILLLSHVLIRSNNIRVGCSRMKTLFSCLCCVAWALLYCVVATDFIDYIENNKRFCFISDFCRTGFSMCAVLLFVSFRFLSEKVFFPHTLQYLRITPWNP